MTATTTGHGHVESISVIDTGIETERLLPGNRLGMVSDDSITSVTPLLCMLNSSGVESPGLVPDDLNIPRTESFPVDVKPSRSQ